MSKSFLIGKRHRLYRGLLTALLTSSSLVSQYGLASKAQAQTRAHCQFTQEEIAKKESLRQSSLKGNSDSEKRYKALLKRHADYLQRCRSRTFPQNQVIWLRLYSCDARPGALDEILDRIVNKGYNQINLEVFYSGQVLLPSAENRTPWPSVVQTPGYENVDLFAQTIAKARERGLKVYAWMFTMNFGYSYSQRRDRQGAIARNGRGQNSLSVVPGGYQLFIDPYSRQAQTDFYQLVDVLMKRRPDGVLFDYIRYPRGGGSDTIADKIEDLWIYGDASKNALYDRALNNQGRELIRRYISKGSISARDVKAVEKLYPKEDAPRWEGRSPSSGDTAASLRWQLWQLSVAHAAQGVLDFLALAVLAAQRNGVQSGAVFFPDANQVVGGSGYDARLQPWDNFPSTIEWHAMSYGVCGNTSCIDSLVKRALERTPSQTQLTPALAGTWGRSIKNRPSLEAQMRSIQRISPRINSISHFDFSWQEPEFDRQRKFCQL
ncbi:MAG: family 10 glycosylhydrolase [Symploca sp. SIO1B1]|nr:family 10 glycosylhydrolase [Symploca sp. SIO1C2]NER47861.1 family 10 glycosylhydrolase [Symploca sp. SIO1A3]NER96332.1 family 10 glycosylhydrolase [Symploca sp. SIO1B1]